MGPVEKSNEDKLTSEETIETSSSPQKIQSPLATGHKFGDVTASQVLLTDSPIKEMSESDTNTLNYLNSIFACYHK